MNIAVVEQRVVLIEKLGVVLPFSDRAYVEWRRLIVAHQVIGVAVHDAKLVATMIAAKVQYILTMNESDFRRYAGITILTPEGAVGATSSHPAP